MRALDWLLFAQTAWAQPATVVAGITGEGDGLALSPFVGVGTTSHCGGGNDWFGRCSVFCPLGRRGLKHPKCWRARQLREMLRLLFARSAWAHPTTVVGHTTCEGGALAFVRLVSLGPTSHFGGGPDR
jgi:hypothetical protein